MPDPSESDQVTQSADPQGNDRPHILVVDDDLEIAEAIRHALQNEGFEVSMAADGNTCLAITETRNPDLIVLDLMMPGRSGLLVLERLRQYFERPIPVIVITGNTGNRHREYAELLGADEYLHKPFTMIRLIDSVKSLLDRESTEEASAD